MVKENENMEEKDSGLIKEGGVVIVLGTTPDLNDTLQVQMGTQIAGSSVGYFELISVDQEAHQVLKILYSEDSIIDMNVEFAIEYIQL
jgi:hypothetical protein